MVLPTAFSKHENQDGTACSAEPPIQAPLRLLTFRDLRERKGIRFSRPWLDRLVKEGKFPKPIRPGGGRRSRGAHKCWIEAEVDAHIQACAALRDQES